MLPRKTEKNTEELFWVKNNRTERTLSRNALQEIIDEYARENIHMEERRALYFKDAIHYSWWKIFAKANPQNRKQKYWMDIWDTFTLHVGHSWIVASAC